MRTVAKKRDLDPKRWTRNNGQKWCPKCERWKPRTEEHFYRAKNGWQGYCQPCTRPHPQYRGKSAERLKALKDGQRCMDCGHPFRYFQLDYDHRPGEQKRAPVARLASQNCSWETIEAEIAKCDLICANCHRMRTWLRATGAAV